MADDSDEPKFENIALLAPPVLGPVHGRYSCGTRNIWVSESSLY